MLSKIAVLLALFAVTQAHSIEKRETTVNEALQEVSLSEAALIVVGVLLAVLFASSAYEIFLSRTFGGVGFKARIGESDDGLQHNFLSQVDSSIDLVDTAFNYMDIEDEECRLKTVCEMERYAVNHPLAKLAINTVNSNLSGLSKYQDAIEAGMNNYDCTLLYSQCSGSYFGY